MFLTTLAKVKEIRKISSNVTTDQFNQFIKESQDIELKSFLGDEMFYDLISGMSEAPPSAIYSKLMGGGTYTINDNTISFDGLELALSYLSYARFLENHGVNPTRFGTVIKSNDQSEPVSEEALSKHIGNARNAAMSYINDVEKFLNEDNGETYELWSISPKYKPKRKARFIKIQNI